VAVVLCVSSVVSEVETKSKKSFTYSSNKNSNDKSSSYRGYNGDNDDDNSYNRYDDDKDKYKDKDKSYNRHEASKRLKFKANGLVYYANGTFYGIFNGTIEFSALDITEQLELFVSGKLTGTVKRAGSRTARKTSTKFHDIPANLTISDETFKQLIECETLTLDLAPIDLNSLGALVVEMSPITIDMSAVPNGGLLRDILCSIAGFLSGVDLELVLLNLIRVSTQALGLLPY